MAWEASWIPLWSGFSLLRSHQPLALLLLLSRGLRGIPTTNSYVCLGPESSFRNYVYISGVVNTERSCFRSTWCWLGQVA